MNPNLPRAADFQALVLAFPRHEPTAMRDLSEISPTWDTITRNPSAMASTDALTASAELTTALLSRLCGGSAEAEAELAPLIFRELRRVAQGHLRRERPNHTLQATALVNEVWIRLAGHTAIVWENRAHFFSVSSRLMREILVDYARRRNAGKRGGPQQQITLQDHLAAQQDHSIEVLALDQALERLQKFDARAARIVEMHFFAGLSFEEMGLVLDVSARTVRRDWRMARAWLRGELSADA
jgi:RNA polymerase sigma factor (TIGR02999 family)